MRLEYGGTEGGRLIFKREFDRGAICYAIVPFDELPTGEKLISEILEAFERLRSPVGLSKDHQPPRQ